MQNRFWRICFWAASGVIAGVWGAPHTNADALEDTPAIDNVQSAFSNLRDQGEWMAAWPAPDMPDSGAAFEATDKHYQSIQRAPYHPGSPNNYLYVTRSGRVDNPDDLGFLAVIQLGTRNHSGERFRSNLLLKGAETSSTLPASSDRVIRVIYYDDYQHPGGTQMVGDILAVPLETKDEDQGSLPEAKIRFYDCSNPANPVALSYEMTFTEKKGVVALTKLPEPDGRFLLLVTGGDNSTVDYYRSNKSSFFESGFAFVHHDTWTTDDQPSLLWPGGKTSWQALNFIKQTDGKLFLIGSHNDSDLAPIVNGDDEIALYEVFGYQAGGNISLTQRSTTRHIDLEAKDEPGQSEHFGNFNAGGGAYISPSGELLYYSIHHYDVPDIYGTVRLRMAELRHKWVNRHGTCGPQFRTNHLGGPYTINEGETLPLDGTVYVISPWVDFFGDTGWDARAEMMDYVDQSLDDYQDFSKLDGAGLGGKNGFGDEMSSFRWCGSPNYRLEIYKDDNFSGDSITRVGTGALSSTSNVGEDFNDKASSARIVRISNPSHPGYAWALDGDGQFNDAVGTATATFGPKSGASTTTVYMSYDDQTVSTTVTVLNVPPTIDVARFNANSTVEGQAVNLHVEWSDAAASTHSATVNWNDGSTPDSRNFAAAQSGSFDISHVYADNGNYLVTIQVSDGDDTATTVLNLPVSNAIPSVEAGSNQTATEGQIVTLAPATFNDLGTLDTHTATIDWGDGSTLDVGVVSETPFGPPGNASGANGSVSGSHVYADNGTYTVRVCVADDDQGTACDTLTVVVSNVIPTIDAGPNRTAVEGDLVSLQATSFNDLGTADTHTATVNWGDGTATAAAAVTESPFGPPGSTDGADGVISASHVYADNGTYTVEVCVTDDENATACGTFSVNVGNAAPTVKAGPNVSINEGDAVSLPPSTFNDPGTLDTHTAVIDWGDTTVVAGVVAESPFGPPGSTGGADGTVAGTHFFGDNGVYTVTVTVKDDDGDVGSDSFSVTVGNIDPTVSLDTSTGTDFGNGPAFTGQIGVEQSHNASSDDVGSDDLQFVWTVIDEVFGVEYEIGNTTYYNDGANPDPTPSALGIFPFHADDEASVVFSGPGVYTLRVAVNDDDGGKVEETLTKLVVGNDSCTRSTGLWRQQFSEHGRHQVDDGTLTAYLAYVEFASAYFSEVVPVASFDDVRTLLQPRNMDRGNATRDGGNENANMDERTAQELFAAWLNVASGAVGLAEVLDNGMTVLETLNYVEAILMEPASQHADYLEAQAQLRLITNIGCR